MRLIHVSWAFFGFLAASRASVDRLQKKWNRKLASNGAWWWTWAIFPSQIDAVTFLIDFLASSSWELFFCCFSGASWGILGLKIAFFAFKGDSKLSRTHFEGILAPYTQVKHQTRFDSIWFLFFYWNFLKNFCFFFFCFSSSSSFCFWFSVWFLFNIFTHTTTKNWEKFSSSSHLPLVLFTYISNTNFFCLILI